MNNGSLSYDEMNIGIEWLARLQSHNITKKEWEWIKKIGTKIDTKTEGKFNENEFWEFTNAIF